MIDSCYVEVPPLTIVKVIFRITAPVTLVSRVLRSVRAGLAEQPEIGDSHEPQHAQPEGGGVPARHELAPHLFSAGREQHQWRDGKRQLDGENDLAPQQQRVGRAVAACEAAARV